MVSREKCETDRNRERIAPPDTYTLPLTLLVGLRVSAVA
jgi:hypothetical protein